MPSAMRIIQPPYTGVAVIQYFIYRHESSAGARPASESDVRAVLEGAVREYRISHDIYRPVSGISRVLLQTPADRGFEGYPIVLRVIPDGRRPS